MGNPWESPKPKLWILKEWGIASLGNIQVHNESSSVDEGNNNSRPSKQSPSRRLWAEARWNRQSTLHLRIGLKTRSPERSLFLSSWVGFNTLLRFASQHVDLFFARFLMVGLMITEERVSLEAHMSHVLLKVVPKNHQSLNVYNGFLGYDECWPSAKLLGCLSLGWSPI